MPVISQYPFLTATFDLNALCIFKTMATAMTALECTVLLYYLQAHVSIGTFSRDQSGLAGLFPCMIQFCNSIQLSGAVLSPVFRGHVTVGNVLAFLGEGTPTVHRRDRKLF